MPRILLTNDDGIDSPALVPTLRALAELGEVDVLVPHAERSWIGKAITRFEDLRVDTVEREGCTIHTATGTPADCTQLGIHNLFGAPPDLVVSGINVGFNHGLAFLHSSGTVGAVKEAWIAQVPGLAVSTGNVDDHYAFAQEARSGEPVADEKWARAAAIARDVAAVVLERGLPAPADLVSVNFGWGSGPETPREVTRLGRVSYDGLFQPTDAPDTFGHKFGELVHREESLHGSDVVAAREGRVSITPVRLAHTAEIGDEDRRAFERA